MQKPFFFILISSACLVAIAGIIQLHNRTNKVVATSSTTQIPSEVVVSGKDIEGSILNINGDRGQPLKLKIASVELDPKDSEKETYLYTVLYQEPTNSKWLNICQPDRDKVAKAIPLSGHWNEAGAHIDDGRITFGCTVGALAKCVRMGYKPWKIVKGRSLRDYHQACTRMVRADYCGDGKSHTKDGTLIDIYDRLKIQKQTPNSGMVFEAAWQPNGVAFIHRTRLGKPLDEIQKQCPERVKNKIVQSDRAKAEIQKSSSPALIFNDSFVR